MSDLVKINTGCWISRDQIKRVIHVTAYTGDAETKSRPSVCIKFPDHNMRWEFETYEAAENFAYAMVVCCRTAAMDQKNSEQ